MTHYPVTTSFWRGVFPFSSRPLNRTLRRACDWRRERPDSTSQGSPTCPDCVAYKAALVRMGYVSP